MNNRYIRGEPSRLLTSNMLLLPMIENKLHSGCFLVRQDVHSRDVYTLYIFAPVHNPHIFHHQNNNLLLEFLYCCIQGSHMFLYVYIRHYWIDNQ